MIEQYPANLQQIIVKKVREKQYQKSVLNKRRDARRIFFTQSIRARLKWQIVSDEQYQQILNLFLDKQQRNCFEELGTLTKYKKQIQQLTKQLLLIKRQHEMKTRECLPMQQIIKRRFDTLKIIRIQYQPKIDRLYFGDQFFYSIPAFELFKVVHENKLLNQVTLKGVQVQYFRYFINQLNRSIFPKSIDQLPVNDLSWMKSFNPPKGLKLCIDALVQFKIQNKNDTLSRINDLLCFGSLFTVLSDISAIIWFGKWSQINQWKDTLYQLWRCLKGIKNIKIKIWGIDSVGIECVRIVRPLLFGELASFTEIVHLSFYSIKFSSVGVNDYLAIEQSLRTLFKNNAVTHLQLNNCRNFPIVSKMTNLQFIDLQNMSFWKQFGFMREVALTNPQLKSIKFYKMEKDWRIGSQLFNQLQNVIIDNCSRISFIDISSQSPSNIKHLKIWSSSVGSIECLSAIFPKLSSITYLALNGISFGHKVLCAIPSPHLEELHISNNNTITGEDLQAIDSKWPYLNSITLWGCRNLTEHFWSVCKFKGLMQLRLNRGKESKAIVQSLKIRGIKVDYD